jgi:hypothetical protein
MTRWRSRSRLKSSFCVPAAHRVERRARTHDGLGLGGDRACSSRRYRPACPARPSARRRSSARSRPGSWPAGEVGLPVRRPRSAPPVPAPSRWPGRTGCRGCRARRSWATATSGCRAACRSRRPASWPAAWPSGVAGLDAEVFQRHGQRQELAQRIPAQVVFLDQLLTCFGAEPPAPVSYMPPPAISGTMDSILALVPSSMIGNRSVR